MNASLLYRVAEALGSKQVLAFVYATLNGCYATRPLDRAG